MKSHVDFASKELVAIKGAVSCFKDALIKNPKIVPKNRPWNDNERNLRIEHLDHVYNIFSEMQNGKNSVTIDLLTICFDLTENDVLAAVASCNYAAYALENDEEVKNKVENADEVLKGIKDLLATFNMIGIDKLTMVYEYE